MNRSDLLKKLQLVEPGVSTQEVRRQSSCVIFRRGHLYSLSMEVACCIPCEEIVDGVINAAVKADKLIEILKKLPEDEVDITFSGAELRLKAGKARVVKIPLEEPLLPVDDVERPNAWFGIADNELLDKALKGVISCTSKNQKTPFAQRCVHITPRYLEACDNIKLMRVGLPLPVNRPVLVRADSLREVIGKEVTNMAETPTWLHFYTEDELRLSIRKLDGAKDYPDHTKFLNMRGTPLDLPKTLKEHATLAGVFNDTLQIMISQEMVKVIGCSPAGEYIGEIPCKCSKVLSFYMPYKLAQEIASGEGSCEVSGHTLRVEGDNYVYVCSLR